MTKPQPELPIDSVLPKLRDALASRESAVLVATPGAGKTTRVPLDLLNSSWLRGRTILMLEPRRLAARMAAERMAETIGQKTGGIVGYRVRLDAKVSTATRIEVVTEGVFTRRIQDDPELKGVGLIIFDEFHERSLDADLGIALALDARAALRPDLKILVMSATIDAEKIATLLGGAAVIESSHRPHPVETRYVPRDIGARLEDAMAATIVRALDRHDGSVLAFLPGEREIRRTIEALESRSLPDDVDLAPLYGALSWADQRRAAAPPAERRRKVVLATTIAETSLTIEGVSIVVDSGLKRAPRFDPRRGMSELATIRVSRAAAEQRRGRAGRLGPGVCYRLWPEAEDRALPAFDEPEIVHADLAALALDVAAWGVSTPTSLSWPTPPPPAAYAQAQDLLRGLGAIDAAGRITDEGKAMARLPLHPRLAHMVRVSGALKARATAADVAAVLSERDVSGGRRDIDIRVRLTLLGEGRAPERLKSAARQIRDLARADKDERADAAIGRLIAAAYPDRIAQTRGPRGKFKLSGGGSATVEAADSLAGAEYLAIADLDGAAADSRVFLAAPIALEDIEQQFSASIFEDEEIVWDDRSEAVVARRVRRLGALVLSETPIHASADDRIIGAALDGVRRLGMSCLPWTENLAALRARVAFARAIESDQSWPDLSDASLLAGLSDWLAPFMTGITRRGHFGRIDLEAAVMSLLPWSMQQRLNEIAPTRVLVPSGSSILIDYSGAGGPSVSVKLQEVFGLEVTPTVGRGRVAITLNLLSPAQRPLAVTADLASFWRNVYPSVRAEMRGRYPRHNWPDDPIAALPSRRSIKPRA